MFLFLYPDYKLSKEFMVLPVALHILTMISERQGNLKFTSWLRRWDQRQLHSDVHSIEECWTNPVSARKNRLPTVGAKGHHQHLTFILPTQEVSPHHGLAFIKYQIVRWKTYPRSSFLYLLVLKLNSRGTSSQTLEDISSSLYKDINKNEN